MEEVTGQLRNRLADMEEKDKSSAATNRELAETNKQLVETIKKLQKQADE
jgi:cell division protein FtsB